MFAIAKLMLELNLKMTHNFHLFAVENTFEALNERIIQSYSSIIKKHTSLWNFEETILFLLQLRCFVKERKKGFKLRRGTL